MSALSRDALESKYRMYRRLTVALGAISVFLAVVLVGQIGMNTSTPGAADPTPGASESSSEPSADSPVARRDPDDAMAMGDIDAPVVLSQWTDLRCPFCAAFHRDSLPALIAEYVDAGTVRIELHDVAFFGEQSEDAAVAARAAGKQGRYFEYLDAVYDAAPAKGHPDLPRETLLRFAEDARVPDIEQFAADLDDPALRAAVRESTATAQSLGVNAVPFFVTSDTALSGAQPLDVFRQFLDQAAGQAR